jgi:hypothetical protein
MRNKIFGIYYSFQRPSHFRRVVKKIKQKIIRGKKIAVGFFVFIDSMFSMEPLFIMMQNEKIFTPFIVIIPDIARGKENMFSQLEKTYNSMSKKYKNVFMSYNKNKRKFTDFSRKFDIACFATPYDNATHRFYRVTYLSKFDNLPVYIPYGYTVSNWFAGMYHSRVLPCFWMLFFENNFILNEFRTKSFVTKKALVCKGYIKTDRLAQFQYQERKRKKIIIAPHHTVTSDTICFSTFLQYAEFFLWLPKKYPDIDFVFRPHPLLKVSLLNSSIWTKEQIIDYFEKIARLPNMEYQDGGDYFETFVNSEALIHDCGSFMAEYLYTDHPACFLLKDEEQNKKNYNHFAFECISHHYKAYTEDDIVNFIDNVIVDGNDTMKEERINFANQNIRINYPYATKAIMDYLKKELT